MAISFAVFVPTSGSTYVDSGIGLFSSPGAAAAAADQAGFVERHIQPRSHLRPRFAK
ncbi:MAG: hypothetical protein U0Q18_25475 [Bryobacteraceae bacterium]